MNTTNGKLRKSPPKPPAERSHIPPVHWLFRSNIPRRRTSYIPPDIRQQNLFGMGEIIGVLTNVSAKSSMFGVSTNHYCYYTQPVDTARSLAESKKLLDEARKEINESRERSQPRPKHSIQRLPGFFPRKAEMLALERVLEGEPSFTILCGASSVGKVCFSPHASVHQFKHIYISRLHCCEKFSRVKSTTFFILIYD